MAKANKRRPGFKPSADREMERCMKTGKSHMECLRNMTKKKKGAK
jgi:hypothetical protein